MITPCILVRLGGMEDSNLILAVPTLSFGRQAYIRACPDSEMKSNVSG
ncbi:MAG: hypothetical protein H8E82_05835 [Candidatus Marinimicrobia bacterium]|nr:hypothetical protein [Candidatus Neomarinimicrobiota bacterium]